MTEEGLVDVTSEEREASDFVSWHAAAEAQGRE